MLRLHWSTKKFNITQNILDELQQRIELVLTSKKDPRSSNELGQKEQKRLINLYKQGRAEEALTQANKLVVEYPRSIFLFNIIGVINRQLGQFNEAIKAFSKAIDINPKYETAYYNLGNCFKSKGMLSEAVESYKRELKINPDYKDTYNNLSIISKDIEFIKPSKSLQNIFFTLLD